MQSPPIRELCLDTETTGISWKSGHRVIEIGIIELVNRQLTGNDYHVYLNPQRSVEQSAVDVHGLTDDFLSDKQAFYQIADDLLEYLKGSVLIIHNTAFDMGFLNMEFSRLRAGGGFDLSDYCQVIDTLAMAKKKHIGQKNNLDALCKRYGVDAANRVLHGALLDAELLSSVYLAMTRTQFELFEKNKNGGKKPQERSIDTSLDVKNIPVVKATPDEVELHLSFVKRYFPTPNQTKGA